jgi:hypothetical protein
LLVRVRPIRRSTAASAQGYAQVAQAASQDR